MAVIPYALSLPGPGQAAGLPGQHNMQAQLDPQ